MRKILVLGASGFIGKILILALVKKAIRCLPYLETNRAISTVNSMASNKRRG